MDVGLMWPGKDRICTAFGPEKLDLIWTAFGRESLQAIVPQLTLALCYLEELALSTLRSEVIVCVCVCSERQRERERNIEGE